MTKQIIGIHAIVVIIVEYLGCRNFLHIQSKVKNIIWREMCQSKFFDYHNTFVRIIDLKYYKWLLVLVFKIETQNLNNVKT